MTPSPAAHPRPPPLPPSLAGGHPRPRPMLNITAPSSNKGELRSAGDDELEILGPRPAKRRRLSPSSSPNGASSPSVNTNGATGSVAPIVEPSPATRFAGAPWSLVMSSVKSDPETTKPEPQLPPLPTRPWASRRPREAVSEVGRAVRRIRRDIAVPNTPDTVTVPEKAPVFEDGKKTDYFPWTGTHPEDVLNDANVKHGYMDRAPNQPEKELNTARTSLYNAFKHRSGLETLSAIFSLVWDQKRGRSTFSSCSSFKGPPPRVTLTEAKRKSWISDLANLDVPLRRLSKTIPQGIRGQLLFEQCLQHLVPLNRAIWFAKCVGANEIRTLQRKGATTAFTHGATSTWLREWTINLQQFVEQVLAQAGQQKWRLRIQYCVQLATRLYMENMLDRDYYLDWIVKSLAAANIGQVPFWLMIVNMHRRDLVAYRKRAKPLAVALIAQYTLVSKQLPSKILQPLAARLEQCMRAAILLRPSAFLLPEQWSDCTAALEACLDPSVAAETELYASLRDANQRTMRLSSPDQREGVTPQEAIVRVLDAARAPFDFVALSKALQSSCDDRPLMLRTCLQWCVSRFRAGAYRVYLIARLFRRWARNSLETEATLLSFLLEQPDSASVDVESMRHLFFELSRSRSFSISKYLQALAVRGLPRASIFSPSPEPFFGGQDSPQLFLSICHEPLQLLTEIGLIDANDHVRNMRNTALSRAGFVESNERQIVEECCSLLHRFVLRGAENTETDLEFHRLPNFGKLPWSMRAVVSHSLRDWIADAVISLEGPVAQEQHDNICSLFDTNKFCMIRNILEQLHDIVILADIIRMLVDSKDERLLAAIVDTIHFHAEPLSAIGALVPLQTAYSQRYLTLRPVKTSMPHLAVALMDLCQQYPNTLTPVKALQQDFVRGDRTRAIAACSPFSDGVAESLQQAGATFYDDFEAILQTESSMNEQTFSRLFGVLGERIEKAGSAGKEIEPDCFTLCQLLHRLKLCRKVQGDNAVRKWLGKWLSTAQAADVYLLPNLLGTGCISLQILLDTLPSLSQGSTGRHTVEELIRSVAFGDKPEHISWSNWYCVKLQFATTAQASPVGIFEVVATHPSVKSKLRGIGATMIIAIATDTHVAHDLPSHPPTIFTHMLAEMVGVSDSSPHLADEVQKVCEAIGPLSLPFVALRLRLIAAARSDEAAQEEIARGIYAAIESDKISFASCFGIVQAVLQAAGPGVGNRLRQQAEQQLYQALPKFLQTKSLLQHNLPTESENRQSKACLQRLLLINSGTATPPHSMPTSSLLEKLSIYLKSLGPPAPAAASTMPTSPVVSVASPISSRPFLTTPETVKAFVLGTIETLTTLGRMACIKRAILVPAQSQISPATAKQHQQDHIKLVGLLITIATHTVWNSFAGPEVTHVDRQRTKDVVDYLFDVSATLVDDMSDESRSFCLRLLREKSKDDRVKWLLGNVNSFGSVQCKDVWQGLQLSHESKATTIEFKPKTWEMMECGGSNNASCLGLGLFAARQM